MVNQSPETTVTISRTTISNTLDCAKKNQRFASCLWEAQERADPRGERKVSSCSRHLGPEEFSSPAWSLMRHLSPKTLRQFCFPENKSLITKSPMGQKDKGWDGRTWVERPQVVLGAGWALLSLRSLDLYPVRQKGQELQSSQNTRWKERIWGIFIGKNRHRGDPQDMSLCKPYQSFTFVRNGRTVSQYQLVPPILSPREVLLRLDHWDDPFQVRVPFHEDCQLHPLGTLTRRQKTWLCEAVWPLSSCRLCCHRPSSRQEVSLTYHST